MSSGHADSVLSALFIDYDNIYLALKSRNEEAAARFARNPMSWITQIVNGRLIRSADRQRGLRRRIAVARCYGNPVPWRLGRNGPEDPNCFAFVRHHFMRAGMEVVDCPKVTSNFKNASDIRITCDIRDYLEHRVRFDEFIILSGDSDFTPVLFNLRSHDRRRAIYTNEYTSPYYRAFCDGWVEESDLIGHLMQNSTLDAAEPAPELTYDNRRADVTPVLTPKQAGQPAVLPEPALQKRRAPAQNDGAVQSLIADFKLISKEITQLVVDVVENSHKAVPLAYLADRAQKAIGQPKTVGTNWAGSGGFLNFLQQNLPSHLKISEKPPQVVYVPGRHAVRAEQTELQPAGAMAPKPHPPREAAQQQQGPVAHHGAPQTNSSKIADLQQSITRIYTACQAPPLPPSEYQLLFTLIAAEVRERGFQPGGTAEAVITRAQDAGLKLSLKDVSFVLDAVDEIDPWLERTQSAAAVARAYRDYVIARCKTAGLHMSDDEHQLIQVWFGASQWGQGQQGAEGPSNGQGRAHPQDQRLPPQPRQPLPSANDYGMPGGGFPALPNGRGNSHAEKNDIPQPPDFGFGPEEPESPFDLGALSTLRFNFSKRN